MVKGSLSGGWWVCVVGLLRWEDWGPGLAKWVAGGVVVGRGSLPPAASRACGSSGTLGCVEEVARELRR